MASLADTLGPISARLGELEGEPAPLEGGITNRNYRARFAGDDVVDAAAGQGHRAAGDRPRAPSGRPSELAARAGVGPEVVAMLDDPPCLVTRFVVGEPMSAERAARAGGAGRGRGGAAGAARLRGAAAGRRSPPSASSRPTRRGWPTAAPRSRARYEWAHGRGAPDRSGAGRRPSTSRSPATTTSSPPTSSARRRGIRIVDWEYAGMGDRYFDLGNFAVNNELDDGRGGGAARRLLRGAGERAAGSPRCG